MVLPLLTDFEEPLEVGRHRFWLTNHMQNHNVQTTLDERINHCFKTIITHN
jgi:hypothetical protein